MKIENFDCISDVLYGFIKQNDNIDYFGGQKSTTLKNLFMKFIREEDYTEKRNIATDVVKQIFKMRGKHETAFPFDILMEMEERGTFYKDYRDHVIHTVYVFLLGYYIYKTNSTIYCEINKRIDYIEKEYIKESGKASSIKESDKCDYKKIEDDFLYMWSLITIYHDYGYVFEHVDDERKIEFFNNLIDVDYSCNNKSYFKLTKDFDKDAVIKYLTNLNIQGSTVNGFELIKGISETTNLSNQGCNGLENYFNFCFDKGINGREYLDHGIISSLLFMKLSNIVFLERNKSKDDVYIWDESIQITYFKYVAQAIAVHNIYVNEANQDTYKIYHLNLGDKDDKNNIYKISVEKEPFAYLLALCDGLQEWDRKKSVCLNDKSNAEQNELTSRQVKVEVESNGSIHFYYSLEDIDKKGVQNIEELNT